MSCWGCPQLRLLRLEPTLQEAILLRVPQPDVHCSVALVCRQLYLLQKGSKAIWRSFELRLFAQGPRSKRSMVAAMTSWLADRQLLIAELHISIGAPGWLRIVAGLLQLLTGPTLQELELSTTTDLKAHPECTSHLLAPLRDMSSLTQLRLQLIHMGAGKGCRLPSLHRLTRLQALSWAVGQAPQATPAGLGRLAGLTCLETDFCVEQAPAMLSLLTQLKHLSLNCMLRQAPQQELWAFLSALTGLEALAVVSAQPSKLPAAVGALAQLTSLRWQGSSLCYLPSSTAPLEHLSQLRQLHLESCRLPRLPPQLTALTALEALCLRGNPGMVVDLGDLHVLLHSMPRLARLGLDERVIRALGARAWVQLGRRFPLFELEPLAGQAEEAQEVLKAVDEGEESEGPDSSGSDSSDSDSGDSD